MSKLTTEQLAAIIQRENGRVGLEVRDRHGVSYWITDVSADDRLRVVGEDGAAYWFNSASKYAAPIKTKYSREAEK